MNRNEYLEVYGVSPCLEGLTRKDVTDELSRRLEKSVLARRNAWACWAAEVKLPDGGRVDYVDFCPHPSIDSCSVGSVERGKFTFYEVKSCVADLRSGSGVNFAGDVNWMVCPVEMVEDMRQRQIDEKRAGILAFGLRKNGSRGFSKIREEHADGWRDHSFRGYGVAELLYAMTRAGVRQGRCD